MIKTIELLEAVIQSYGGRKGDTAKGLGVHASTLSTWIKRRHVSPQYATRCAELIGENPAFAEAIAGAETIEDEGARMKVLRAVHKAYDRSFKFPLMTLNWGL